MTRRRQLPSYDNSIAPPTYQSASYYFNDARHVRETLHHHSPLAGRYGRYSNPSWLDVEHVLSSLNKADSSLIFASGMAAHTTTFLTFLQAGDEVLFPAESYRQVRNVFRRILPKFGVIIHESSIKKPDAFVDVACQLASQLKLVHLEMPSSPHMYLIDIEAVRAALGADTILTMDSSFAPPPNFYALKWGVDLVLFSATKYLGGHGDLVAGVLSGRRDLIERVRWFRDTTGPVVDGHVAALLRRSLYTLDMRVRAANAHGLQVAEYLDNHPRVTRVFYTGISSHPHYELSKKYLHGHGAVVTFELGVDEEAAAKIVDRLTVPYMASNFGTPQTLVEQSTFFTYFEYDDETLRDIGVDRSTVRLAIGFADDPSVIIADLERALNY
jgi:cystathionine gamma-synthase